MDWQGVQWRGEERGEERGERRGERRDGYWEGAGAAHGLAGSATVVLGGRVADLFCLTPHSMLCSQMIDRDDAWTRCAAIIEWARSAMQGPDDNSFGRTRHLKDKSQPERSHQLAETQAFTQCEFLSQVQGQDGLKTVPAVRVRSQQGRRNCRRFEGELHTELIHLPAIGLLR